VEELTGTGFRRSVKTTVPRSEREAVPETRSVDDGETPADPRPDVLVVEDDEDELRIIDRAIRRHGMESRFKIVRSGEDALSYLRPSAGSEERGEAPRPKVVLLDLKLGGIGGQEVLRRVRADDRLCTLPIVVVSSSRDENVVSDCYRLGANSFVPKQPGLEYPGDRVVEIARYWLELNRTVPAP